MMMNINKIYEIDNLEFLKQIKSNSINLVYIDPPFFSQKKQVSSKYQYNDKWKNMEEYLEFMIVRIKELHRILNNNGSIYIHIDQNAIHYIKIEMDKIFGNNNFISEIIWKRVLATKTTSKSYGNNVDYILFYTKSSDYTFNMQKIKLNDKQIKRDYNNIEKETGRKFTHCKLIGYEYRNPIKKLHFKDINIDITAPEGYGFYWSQRLLNEKLDENPNRIYWMNGFPRYKVYLDTHKGMEIGNLWDDINPIASQSNENTSYPTQKPEKLLERIIKTSSNEGDTVLDCFLGSGTTLAVAKRLNRKYIGCDENPSAVKITKDRLNSIVKNNTNRLF